MTKHVVCLLCNNRYKAAWLVQTGLNAALAGMLRACGRLVPGQVGPELKPNCCGYVRVCLQPPAGEATGRGLGITGIATYTRPYPQPA